MTAVLWLNRIKAQQLVPSFLLFLSSLWPVCAMSSSLSWRRARFLRADKNERAGRIQSVKFIGQFPHLQFQWVGEILTVAIFSFYSNFWYKTSSGNCLARNSVLNGINFSELNSKHNRVQAFLLGMVLKLSLMTIEFNLRYRQCRPVAAAGDDGE